MASGMFKWIQDRKPSKKDQSQLFIQKLYVTGLINQNSIMKTSHRVYTLQLKSSASNKDTEFKKMEFGNTCFGKTNKVIMMVGETGAGKSTLINAMINYILGVKWTDEVRVKLFEENTNMSEAHSQTSQIHIYKINHIEGFRIPFSLTLIDTPGFGHTGGKTEDAKISQQIKECFMSHWGIEYIDAVAFVVKASDIRLTPSQRYVFESVLSIFGQDIKQNIIFCITYSERKGIPKVLKTLSEASVPCAQDVDGGPYYFKFNNSDISQIDNDDEDDDFSEEKSQWGMREKSLKNLFAFLETADNKSLTLTREVLKEREALEIALEGLTWKIEEALLKADILDRNKIHLEEHHTEIQENEQFEFVQYKIIKVKAVSNHASVNCTECESTCHYPSKVPFMLIYMFSKMFSSDTLCKVCGHDKREHKREKYKWEQHIQKSNETYRAMKKTYSTSISEIETVEQLCTRLGEEIQEIESDGLKFAMRVSECLERLRVIALQQTRHSTADYIDMMITNEECNEKPRYTERISTLVKIREKVKDMEKTKT